MGYSHKRSQAYSFDHVFDAQSQPDNFFERTTLPLIEDALRKDQDGLLFSYGVSNSGKSYSIQGGGPGVKGVLPRAIDVVFNSIQGMDCPSSIKLVGQTKAAIAKDIQQDGIDWPLVDRPNEEDDISKLAFHPACSSSSLFAFKR
jgi:kinesin family protein 20